MIRKTRWHKKVGARVIATAMSAAMGLSSFSAAMPGSIAYAENEDGASDTEAVIADVAAENTAAEGAEGALDSADGNVSGEENVPGDAVSGDVLEENAEASADDTSVGTKADDTSDVAAENATVEIENETADESGASSRDFDPSKTDVWDLGAENLGDEYNNRLDAETINGFYDVEPGTSGKNLASFSVDDGDFIFNDGGYSTTHRLRSTNSGITRYDDKSLKDENGNVFSGYIYSNKGSSSDVYVALDCEPDDTVTFYVASNGKPSSLYFENMSDSTDVATHEHTLGSSTVSKAVFYPANDAMYKIYSATEKLVVARVYREHASYVNVGGAIYGYDGDPFELVFTNNANGNEQSVTVDGIYNGFSLMLADGFEYTMSLRGAEGYVISNDKTFIASDYLGLKLMPEEVELTDVSGKITGVDEDDLADFVKNAKFTFKPQDPDSVFEPKFELSEDGTFKGVFQVSTAYDVVVEGVDEYTLLNNVFCVEDLEGDLEFAFVKKDLTPVEVKANGIELSELANATFKFTYLDVENGFAATDYVYEFNGQDVIDGKAALRDGQYKVSVSGVPARFSQNAPHTKDAKVNADTKATGKVLVEIPFDKADDSKIPYSETVTVGAGKDYESVGDALKAIRKMDRTSEQRVTVEIQPGDYQEMLVIDTPNVTLKNAVAGGSIVPTNKDVSIAQDSVRITGYYGHGYAYYSMGSDCKYDAELLEVNKYNGYYSFENPGTGTTSGSYWNATVVVNAAGFEAYDIIFENSFNQYQSELAAEDVIVPLNGAKEGKTPRAGLQAGDVTVQDKLYVERAAAMAIRKAADKTYFNHCAFIGRQDTLYGDEGSTEAYYNCDIYGGTDYIFGGMTAVFAKCNLVFNTSENTNDVGYITAAQQKSASTRGYLMYNCNVISTVPGENSASTYASKAGYLGRPWQPTTSEVVFYETNIDATCAEYKDASASLIRPEGWLSSLGGTTERNVEYGTFEVSGVNNAAARPAWAPVSDKAETTDGKAISVETFLGSWNPFAANGDDLTITRLDASAPAPAPAPATSSDTTVFTLEASDLTAFAANTKADGDFEKAGTESYFTIIYSAKSKVDSSNKKWEDDYTSDQRINFGGVASTEKNAIKFTAANTGKVKIWWAQGGDDSRQIALLNAAGEQVAVTEGTWTKNSPYISTLDIPAAGTYFLGSAINNNYIFKVEVTLDETVEPVEYDFAASDLTAFAANTKADGDSEKAGTDGYFTLLYSAKSKVDSSNKTWEDGYTSGQRVNFGGAATTAMNSIKFKTTQDNSTLKIWWASNAREMVVLDAAGNVAYKTESGAVKNTAYISTITLEKAGTYYLGGDGGTNYIFRVQVTDGAAGPVARKSWNDVAVPVIEKVALNSSDSTKVDVTVKTVIGNDGGDSLVVTMFDADNNELSSAKSVAEKNSFTLSFVPTKSGDYHFVATLARDDEEAVKTSEASAAFAFVLPLTAPQFKNAVNKGAGTVQVKFYSVAEATEYTLIATDKTDEGAALVKAVVTPEEVVDNTTTEYAHSFVGLTVGHVYEIALSAKRGEDVSKESKLEVTVTSDGEREWVFSAFGSGVSSSKSNNGATANSDGTVTVWCTGNKGKIVPASTDGLSFYYTAVPSDMNFTLTATANIDSWAFTNGQEGFGLMAADRVGVNGNANVFWNNSYMASGTKVEYYYDPEKGAVKDDTAAKISMKLGLGAQQKIGVTKDNLGRLEANDTATVNNEFSSEMFTLETSCGASGAGTYNLFGKETSGTVVGTVSSPLTKVRLRIQKNNTGYFVSYLDESDNVLAMKKFYDTEALSKLDEENVYVGFYASRTFKATFSDIELTLIDPSEDAPAEDKPVTYVVPSYKVVSASNSNTAKYELSYVGNADGVLTIADDKGKKVVDGKTVKAGEMLNTVVKLVKGDNNFKVTFTPDADFLPDGDKYKRLESYETYEFIHTVKYETVNNNDKIFVAPDGKADADGTESAPVDIYTAVKYVQPGQTIELAAGTYNLSSTVKVERGIDGTPTKPIKMVASNGRAVFDFGKRCAGFIFAGNYWYVNGIDCTRSANSQKGIQVSGSHITLEDIRAYENGNTGIQVSRYLSTDDRDLWPSYDLILNCTSYSNADAGYEDADGFAAKLTVGDGVVFDGCIAYNNADDGWDLFAKVESGCIGQVTIQNCVAFANGFGVDGTNEGNGNGFKMGGSSMSGPHKLINSVAWGNKAKGIDSNSGPDIQVYNSMSFNNGANNVALYTNDTANTDYYVDGVISYRTKNTGTNENIKAKGTQDSKKIYGKLNFFWNDGASSNSEGLKLTDDCFVSLDAPYANVSDPYAVAAGLRNADGSINLGDFMKLSDKGVAVLGGAGIESSDVAASLDGFYEAIREERNIAGSSEDAQADAVSEDTVEGEFVKRWGKTYFVTEDGSSAEGIQTIDGIKYHINEKGQVTMNNFVTVDDQRYYFDGEGQMVTGKMKYWGTTYFFKEDGVNAKEELVEYEGSKYYVNRYGVLARNEFITVDGNSYYFDENGEAVTGLLKNWGTIYYFGEDGIQVKDSLVTEDGYTYYITSKGYATKNQFADFEDGTRFFDSDGHMVVGTTITYWFVKYTFDENGILIK
ncbi:MAG: hypothetical protein IKO76_03175 [Butyrivibrio sp.]|nr:hypothetical protein [Butyrivibrio sp.]